jgi:hypothetical protein
MGVYFILLEEETGVRAPHGLIVTGDGTRHRIDNTDELRAGVLDVADQIRAAQRQMVEIIHVNPRPSQCRACGQRGNCGRARENRSDSLPMATSQSQPASTQLL